MQDPPPSERSPLVSIAMCTFNGERFLEQQLDSLVAQNYRPIEIIVSDDGSTDSTREILETYAERYCYIKLHFNDTNLGYCRNFERALGLCAGEYIALCDQDDVWLPEKIQSFVDQIDGHSLVYSLPSFIDADGQSRESPRTSTRQPEGRCPLGLLFSFPITGHLSMIEKSVLDHALPFPSAVQEHDHWLPIVAAAMGGLKPTNSILSYYRVHDKNVSIQKKKKSWNPIQQIGERRDRIRRRIDKRIAMLESVSELSVLTVSEAELLASLLQETRKLKTKFINFRLRQLLQKHEAELLAYCKKPGKMAARLSRGVWYYRAIAYLNRS